MRLLQIILALFSATVWAQTNSTGPTHSNSTGTPYPGVLNSPNLTVIYPKSGDYWSFPFTPNWPVIFTIENSTQQQFGLSMTLNNVNDSNIQIGSTFFDWQNSSRVEPNHLSPATNKVWPAGQYWHPWDIVPHSFTNWTEHYGVYPGSGYFITIYLATQSRTWINPVAISELFEIRNTTTVDPNLPQGPNNVSVVSPSPTPTPKSGALPILPSFGTLAGVGVGVCVGLISVLV